MVSSDAFNDTERMTNSLEPDQTVTFWSTLFVIMVFNVRWENPIDGYPFLKRCIN